MVHDPALGERKLGADEVGRHFSGVALELLPTSDFRPAREAVRLRLRDLISSARALTGPLAQVLALSLVLQLYIVASPFLLQLAVDEGVSKDDRGLLATLAVGFGLFTLVNGGAGLLRSWLLVHVQARLGFVMGTSLCRHLLRLPLAWFERRHTGDLVSRFASLDPVRNLLAEGVVTALVDGAMALLASVMVFAYSVQLGLVVLGAIALYVLLRAAFYPALRRRAQDAVLARAREGTTFIETARAIQCIKVFNAEAGRLALWSNRYGHALAANGEADRLRGVFRALNDVLFGLENVAVVYLGATGVMDGRLSLGMLFAFVSYKQQLVERTVRLVEKARSRRACWTFTWSASPTSPTLTPSRGRRSIARKAAPLRGEVEARGLSFRYAPGEPDVFRGVSFRIKPGEYVAITGPSGGGKTTLLKVLLSLLPTSEGEVLIDGTPLSRLGARELRDQVGVVMQDDMLLSGTIAGNITFFADRPDVDHIHRCATLAGIHDDIAAMPMGYDTLIGDMGFLALRRPAAARADRTRALSQAAYPGDGRGHVAPRRGDRGARERFRRGARAHPHHRAHRPETIASADRVLVFEAGQLREAEAAHRTPHLMVAAQ